MNKQNIKRGLLTLTIIVISGVLLYYYLDKRGILQFFSSEEKIQAYISSFGIWAPLAFIALQVLQVVLAPIPGNIITATGGLMFGFWKTLIISTVSILIGSIICFILARAYGRTLVVKLAGERMVDKYLNKFFEQKRLALYLMFVFPFFPDDALCLIAGLTTMRFKNFVILILLTRPWGIVFGSLLGSSIIEVSLLTWVIIIIISLILFFLVLKYSDHIEKRLNKWYKGLAKHH